MNDSSQTTQILTMDRMKEVYKRVFRKGEAGQFTEFVFRTFDKDNSGSIDFREFLLALSVTRRGTSHKKLEWVFSVYDLNGDGLITKMEMLDVVKAMQKMHPGKGSDVTPEEKVDQIFELMDKNGDEQLSMNEFTDGVKKYPGVDALVHFSFSDAHTYF